VHKLIASLLFIALLPSCAASTAVAVPSKNLSEPQVRDVAQHYVEMHNLQHPALQLQRISYEQEFDAWLLLYQYPNLAIGEGHFGLWINDNDPSDVTLSGGL